ncbi:MAG: hypothetical protein A4E28_02424 [Methanocella sp. PtaU1.Bin125]|nr:MAG: hypothetical protein A4E28_02424 [Methanocella sp. PtaU1.Bin125]
MYEKTNYEVIISPDGRQVIRSTSTASRTVIDQDRQTNMIKIWRR